MANICFTFEIDGRLAYMAYTDAADARDRLGKGLDLVEDGGQILRPNSTVSIRPSNREEIDAFLRLAAKTCLAGRVDWEDIMDGFPIFLIEGSDPNFPEEDINTGLPRGCCSVSGLEQSGRAQRYFAVDVEDLSALYRGAPIAPRPVIQSIEAAARRAKIAC